MVKTEELRELVSSIMYDTDYKQVTEDPDETKILFRFTTSARSDS